MNIKLSAIAIATLVALAPAHQAFADAYAPYGTAKMDMRKMPVTDTVFDVNYEDPQKLAACTTSSRTPKGRPVAKWSS